MEVIRSRPSQGHTPDNLGVPYKMKLQYFVRSRPSQGHRPGTLQYEILWLAGPAKTMSLTEWSSKNFIRGRPSQQTWQSEVRNSVTCRPSKDHQSCRMELQNFIGQVCVSTDAADDIKKLEFARLMVFVGPASERISYSRLPGLWFCENHARKMRTFFTRRLEPKTRSSYHIKWSNAKWNTLKQSFS